MKVELKGIEIAMGDKNVKLTLDEAQSLREQLNKLFGEKIVYMPSTPVIVEREVWPWWRSPYYWTPTVPLTAESTPTMPETVTVYCVAADVDAQA